MKRIIIKHILGLLFLLAVNILAADDCGINIYNAATQKLHKRIFVAEQAASKNEKVVSKRCTTNVEKNEYDVIFFDAVANCVFEIGDKIFNRRMNVYEDAEGVGRFIATYNYNMFAYEIET